MIFGENQASDVIGCSSLELINTDKVNFRILGGGFVSRIAQGKTHCHDDVVFFVSELLNIVGIVSGVCCLDVVSRTAKILGCLLRTFPGTLVEAAVIDVTDIRDQPNLNL